MKDIKEGLKSRFKHDADFLLLQPYYLGVIPVSLAGYSTLINFPDTLKILAVQTQYLTSAGEEAFKLLCSLGTLIEGEDKEDQAAKAIVKGSLILCHEITGVCIEIQSVVPQIMSRSIEAPITENVLRGGFSSFNEDLDSNIGLIRKQLVNDELQFKSYRCGRQKSIRLEVLYLKDKVNERLLKKILEQIESKLDLEISNLHQIRQMLGFRKTEFVSKLNTTELPQNTAAALNKGKVVLLLERFPFALILPALLTDMFMLEDDNNFPYPYTLFLRLLRITGILITLLIPGLYVALVSVNPEILRIELALSIAKSRVEVPYPALVETLILLVILELTVEASIRLPKSVGPTLTVVGGIILGEAVVSAKLVSNLLIIILAGTTIASSVVVGYPNSISLRLLKFVVLFLSAVFGVMGLVAGLVIIITYLASIESFGIPYFQFKFSKDEHSG